ncbi:MAG: hypothetical protein PW789_09755 [Edaphobacter sp.]|uniref:hypothetical protein n=1 Tax=Edaphobacter sp. TaxID=1934404 RepID=UPI002395355B|nr:hypothetical protein [Edaphobacter sp.]MDE1176879.1 hypothetical protein [Edaphobacter sp.]
MAVEALALVVVGEDGERGAAAEGVEAEDVTQSVTGRGEAAGGVEGVAVGAGLLAVEAAGVGEAGGLLEDRDLTGWRDGEQLVEIGVGDEEAAIVRPGRAFEPLAAGDELLKLRVGGDQSGGCGREAFNGGAVLRVKRQCGKGGGE